MKRFSHVLGSGVLLSLAMLGLLTGCSGLECADGLVAQDGECVLEDDIEGCEEGKILKDGECVEPESLCDEDTVYDDNLGICVVPYDEVVCGDNTVEDSGQCVAQQSRECGSGTDLDVNTNECVATDKNCGESTEFTEVDGQHVCLPTDEVCGEGTEFSEDAGLCLPDFDCQPGDVVIDGYCVPEVAQLIEDADYEATGNTNPDLGGSPVAMDVADASETTIFSGVIGEPEDINGDGEPDQVIDVFEFDAQEGDWFEVSVRSVGFPNPAFAVRSAEEDNSFERYSALGTDRDKIRQVVIPEEGTYQIAVFPESLLTGGDFLLGDDEWDYAGTLELMETPEADEHNFFEENLESDIGRLDRNFYVADQFEAGTRASFTWEKKPEYAEALATVWASPEEFIGEFDEDSFGVDVPESGEIFIVFDWESRKGDIGLDFEVSADELVILEDGEALTETVSADEGDVLYLEQNNDSVASVDVTITDEGGTSIFTTSLGSGGLERYVGLMEGEYDVTFENGTGDDIEGFDFGVDITTPTELTDVEQEWTGSVNENIAGDQDYYLLHLDERQAFEIDVTRVGDGIGYPHLYIYEIGNAEVVSEGPSFSAVSALFEFAEETTYVLRIGGEYVFSADDYDYTMTFDELSSVPGGGEVTESFSADEGGVLEITQTNQTGADVMVTVTEDASGDVVVSQSLGGGDLLQHFPMEEGDYTATFTNEGEDPVFELEVDVAALPSINEKDFSADQGDVVEITQTNNDDITVDVFITDEGAEVVESDSLSTSGELMFEIDESGEYHIWYFQSGEAEDEQEAAGIEFVVDHLDAFADGEQRVETVAADAGDVLEIRQESRTGQSVDVTISGDDGDLIEESLSAQGLIRYVGLEEGDYEVEFENDSGETILGFESDIGHITPEEITDFDTSYSSTANENIGGEQDYYLVELEETRAFDIDVSREDGSGFPHLFIYGVGDEELLSEGPTATGVSASFVFEENTTYVLRIGGEYSSYEADYEYEMTFDEVDTIADGQEVAASFSATDDDLVEIWQTNAMNAEVDLVVTDDDGGTEILSKTLADGEQEIYFPLEAGDYTATFTNNSGETILELEPSTDVYSPMEEESFDAEADDRVQITQSNAEGTSVDVLIVDESEEVILRDSLSTMGSLELEIDAQGEYAIWYYQSGEAEDEQEAEEIEFGVEFGHTLTIDTLNMEVGDVIEIDREDGGAEVGLVIVHESGTVIAEESIGGTGFFRYIGVEEDGDYDVDIVDFSDEALDPDDYDVSARVEQSEVADIEETYTGAVQDGDIGEQDFYLVELDDTQTLEVIVEKTGGGIGYSYVAVYALGDEELASEGPNAIDEVSVNVEFEANTPYVVRVGGDHPTWDDPYEYVLSFD